MALEVFVFNRDMWLPAEVIRTGNRTEVGYVLNEKDGRLIVLRDDDRRVITIDVGDVRARFICDVDRSSGWFDRAFGRRVFDLLPAEGERGPDYPRCPRSTQPSGRPASTTTTSRKASP